MPEKASFKNLREGERETRKEIILNAAIKLFNTHVFHDVGMRDIAAEAGISPATIYRYFPSRDDILVEALLQDINRIEKRLDTLLAGKRIGMEDLAVEVVDYFLANESTFHMMCHFLTSGIVDPDALKKFKLVQEYFLNMFNMKLKQIKGKSHDVFYTHAFFASVTGVVLTFLHYPGLNKQKKKEYMHRLALAIIKDGGDLSVLNRQAAT
ncbi:MAG: TetR/AcrR family transcriptional regulator [Thermodesulfobacteriota bacterium]|nr:TetR/AcrR family transcriptional regulator [Thermodesulfobacteriota bacterium]